MKKILTSIHNTCSIKQTNKQTNKQTYYYAKMEGGSSYLLEPLYLECGVSGTI